MTNFTLNLAYRVYGARYAKATYCASQPLYK